MNNIRFLMLYNTTIITVQDLNESRPKTRLVFFGLAVKSTFCIWVPAIQLKTSLGL